MKEKIWNSVSASPNHERRQGPCQGGCRMLTQSASTLFGKLFWGTDIGISMRGGWMVVEC